MATTVYTLASAWGSGARYTASGETPVLVNNPNDDTAIHFEVTGSDTTPSVDPVNAGKIYPGTSQGITLADGDRLWLAGAKGYGSVTV